MGLLDSILGAALNQGGGQSQGGGGLGGVLGSMLGGGQGGGGQAALLNIVLGMLANKGGGGAAGAGGMGGLGDLLSKFQQGGMGDVASSWVGKGDNMPISGDQLQSVLGSDMIASIAAQLGMSHGDTASQLSQLLPEVVDRVTPQGQVPDNGFGDISDLLGQLRPR